MPSWHELQVDNKVFVLKILQKTNNLLFLFNDEKIEMECLVVTWSVMTSYLCCGKKFLIRDKLNKDSTSWRHQQFEKLHDLPVWGASLIRIEKGSVTSSSTRPFGHFKNVQGVSAVNCKSKCKRMKKKWIIRFVFCLFLFFQPGANMTECVMFSWLLLELAQHRPRCGDLSPSGENVTSHMNISSENLIRFRWENVTESKKSDLSLD